MSSPAGTRRRDRVLPSGAVPCIWMGAGLIAFKLCDRGLECEACPFDAAMRGGAAAASGAGEAAAATPAPWAFPDDRRYHPGHTWILPAGEGRVRIGLDAFAARLLGHGTSVILPAEGSQLRQGRIGGWILDESELLPIRAPFSGTVLKRNGAAQRHPALMASSPYDEGWLLELRRPPQVRGSRRLLTAEAMSERAEEQMRTFRDRAARQCAARSALVGDTLPDGGEPLNDVRRVLGAARYRRLILPFLR